MPFTHGIHGNYYEADLMPLSFGSHCEDCLYEAWERMTDGGCTVEIDEHPEPVNPWSIYRFREPTPKGGLRLRAWADR